MKKNKKLLVGDTENNAIQESLELTETGVLNNTTVDPQEQFLNPPKKKAQLKSADENKSSEKQSDWNDDITLAPEEYEELDDGSGIKEAPVEKNNEEPDFDLGEASENKDEEFQLTIHFDGSEESKKTEEVKEERKYDPDNPRFIDWVFDIAEMLVFVLAAVIILSSFIFNQSIVEGSSMLKTLENGDRLIISDVFYKPDYDDIIVFEDYTNDPEFRKPLIKRVIALEGDTVEIRVAKDGKTLQVLVNNEPIDDDNAFYLPNITPQPFGPITVEEGHVFVLGDNRYNSSDSRHPGIGTVNVDSIIGKVLFRIFPFDKFGVVN